MNAEKTTDGSAGSWLVRHLRTVRQVLRNEIPFVLANITGSAGLVSIFVFYYYWYGIQDTSIMLGGWDTPFYAWHAEAELRYGPEYMMRFWGYPHFYIQLVALLGYVFGNVVLVQKVLPLLLGIVQVWLLSITAYRISSSQLVASLTGIIAPASIGTLWLVSEFHRNQMAYLLLFLAFLYVSRGRTDKPIRYWLTLTSLLFLIAGTHFETFAIGGVSLIIGAALARSRRNLLFSGLSVTGATGILVGIFPNFLNSYYLRPTVQSYTLDLQLGWLDLAQWSLGSPVLLPVALSGVWATYTYWSRDRSNLSLFVLVFSVLLTGAATLALYTPYEGLSIRAMLLVPTPILLALGIPHLLESVKRILSRRRDNTLTGTRGVPNRQRSTRLGTVVIASLVLVSLVIPSAYWSAKVVIVSYVQQSGYEKIVALSSYLGSANLAAPIVMFHGSSLWVADEYRAYLGVELGDHLAYYGDLRNLSALVPTRPSFPYPANEIASFTSEKYLQDMLGNKAYLIFPERSFVSNASDLQNHPIAFVSPELYDSAIPFYVSKYRVSDGIYVVPSLSLVQDYVNPKMVLEAEWGSSDVEGHYTGANTVVVDMGDNSSWYRLAGIPECLSFSRLVLGENESYPDVVPTRPNGNTALVGNDPSENLIHWSSYPTLSGQRIAIDNASKMEGNASLIATGATDAWGGFPVTFVAPSQMDWSNFSSLAFWGKTEPRATSWVVTIQDARGSRATYWDLGNQTANGHGEWTRIVVGLQSPTVQDATFRFSEITSIFLGIAVGRPGQQVSMSIDDLTIDTPMVPGQVYKARIQFGQSLTAHFVGNANC